MKFIPFRKRKNPRKVRGFLCDEKLWRAQWILTWQLGVPNYVVLEHSLELAGSAIAQVLFDDEAKKNLVEHLTQEHLLKPLLDPDNPYDKQMLEEAKRLELRRQEFEKYTREFMRMCDVEDIDPRFLLVVARRWIETLRDRRRRKDDIPRRW